MKIRFGLKTLLAVTLAVSLFLAWCIGNFSAQAHEERILEGICGDRIGMRGIRVLHSQSERENFGKGAAVGIAEKSPTWFMNQLGAKWNADAFERIYKIQVRSHQLNDDALHQIAELPALRVLEYWDGNFTQDGIAEFNLKRPDVQLDCLGSGR
ncbi:hypothetical protein [Mariniblastus fucicola]|uniref:Uncharacterized protein n=1 Tax=Mariniblastus fucicola TaxID=980251 RepID=A0A5B9PB60_9BACT|nr:hypothetical protein [Mariniblastus fucicola]QEG22220.1 hypothetical protein MFFC18_20960 [Mariniblastus fucicola]